MSENARHKITTIPSALVMPSKLPPAKTTGKNAAIVVRTPIVDGMATRFVPATTVAMDAEYVSASSTPAANLFS